MIVVELAALRAAEVERLAEVVRELRLVHVIDAINELLNTLLCEAQL